MIGATGRQHSTVMCRDTRRKSARRAALIAGATSVMPILLGIVPFAMISGVAALGVGLAVGPAIVMSVGIFAGAAQLAMVQLLGDGASALVIVLTALVINLRFVMYSASIAPHFQRLPGWWKWPLAYLLTDQAYAVSIVRYDAGEAQRTKPWYYLGAASTLWVTWQVGTVAGLVLGASVPASWSLEFAIPLTFMALLFPAIDDRPSAVAALVGGTVAVVAAPLAFNLGLIVAAVSGIAAGLFVETWHGLRPAGHIPREEAG